MSPLEFLRRPIAIFTLTRILIVLCRFAGDFATTPTNMPERSIDDLLGYQNEDDSFGVPHIAPASIEDTAYALLSIKWVLHAGRGEPYVLSGAAARARAWLKQTPIPEPVAVVTRSRI